MREALTRWLAVLYDAADLEIGDFNAPEGVGYSNETLLVDASWTDGGSIVHSQPLVVRLETVGEGVFPQYDLAGQVRCMQQIAAHSSVPVPKIVGLEMDPSVLGRAFYVMDRIDAQVPRDGMPYTIDGWCKEATKEQQAQLWWSSLETMAKLHKLDPVAAGMDFLDRPTFGDRGLQQQVAWWESYADWVSQGRSRPAIDSAGLWLRANMPIVAAPTGVTWGDARISNMMYRNFEPVAVLDWEMASLGPPEVDFAWFCFFQRFFSEGIGFPDLEGFPAYAQSQSRYSEMLGRDLEDLFFYEVFAAWRYAAILARLGELYESVGKIEQGTDAACNNIATRMLADMLDLESPGEPGGPFG